jgi:hypothetical protein
LKLRHTDVAFFQMATQDSADHGSSQLQECYPNIPNRPDLGKKFRDIDDPDQFPECREQLMHEGTRNFVVDFGSDDARCAIDLEDVDFSALMDVPVSRHVGQICVRRFRTEQTLTIRLIQRPKSYETRWMCVLAL